MMSIKKQYQTYQNNAVNTASSGQLTLMLYNGCIKFIKKAIISTTMLFFKFSFVRFIIHNNKIPPIIKIKT